MRFSRLPLKEALNCPYLNTNSKQDGSIPQDSLSLYISHFLYFSFCLLPHLTDQYLWKEFTVAIKPKISSLKR